MDFFKNFYKDDDKIIGLCAFKRKKLGPSRRDNCSNFGALKLVYEPKTQNTNMFFL